jgi:hypothetical protein
MFACCSHFDDKLYVLVKWWRSDNKGGKSHWTDISSQSSIILEVSGPDLSGAGSKRRSKPSKPSTGQDLLAVPTTTTTEVSEADGIATSISAAVERKSVMASIKAEKKQPRSIKCVAWFHFFKSGILIYFRKIVLQISTC